MRILVNSDKNIVVDTQFARFVRGEANRILSRFKDKLTRLEFHLSDVNSQKFGTHDKRCFVEARPAGHKPVTVTAAAATIDSAVRGALPKMRRALQTFFGRMKSTGTAARRAVSPSPGRKKTAPEAGSSRATATRRSVKKSARAQPSASGRSPKKKGIYQARRKSWPKR